jgi:hypothetical protein
MGNPTRFLAIRLDNPEEEYLFHYFEKASWHHIWKPVIPDDAPNDLKYRFEHGPTYTMWNYHEEVGRFLEEPVRRPQVEYSDPRIAALNEYSKSAFELSEFELVRQYLSRYLQSGKPLSEDRISDMSLRWIAEDLSTALDRFFTDNASRFDAIVLDYFL